ncbi:glycoside hydrolase family 18 protein [Amylocarpus encephaloides]|uniref:chitinase n=1 Tax=Amylocarpus encephaloides TaxID=45428 RepID=A0A9P7YNZ6_9HELO|nr:glycoside hydrolase family 18 protein [Amylocarpus encephaloides]
MKLLLRGLLIAIPFTDAGFNPAPSSNIAVYWGQNSYGQGTGPLVQQRLSYYCATNACRIIPLAFLTTLINPSLNFANAGDLCTAIIGTNLFSCPQIEADIKICQTTYSKTILLSIGGATYTEGGFSSPTLATASASNIWSIFGPPQPGSSAPRPFGTAIIDGFDFDFEATVQNMVPFATTLRTLMTAAGGKKYYLTAAPQCPYPDAADGEMLDGKVFFDAIFLQFYNNYCGLGSYIPGSASQNNFNLATWDAWATTRSLNPAVQILVGAPGAPGAAGSGYVSMSHLASVIAYSKSFPSFGGVMVWDMSQLASNAGYLDGISNALGLPPSTTMATSTTAAGPTRTVGSTLPTGTENPGGGTVGQWNQCGGMDWHGGTVCVKPWTCVVFSVWYSQCQ